MKRFFLLLVCLLTYIVTKADGIRITIVDGIDNPVVKNLIESNVTKILNEVNAACKENRALDFLTMEVNERVQQSMAMLWDNSHFICPDDDIVEPCFITDKGYQIRHIPLLMKSIGQEEGTEFQEAVFNFDKQGNIETFYLSVPSELYDRVVRNDLDSTDIKHRNYILDFIELLRTAYYQKDLSFISKTLMKDKAMNIIGKPVQKRNDPPKLKYKKYSSKSCIRKLKRVFKRNTTIKAAIDDIEIMRHPVNLYFYGITLLQRITGDHHQYDGYLFLLWDFRDENAPQIHVRTWQPDKMGGKDLPKDEMFSLSDFDI